MARLSGGNAIATAKGGRKIGGVLISRHPRCLLHAVPLCQVAAGQLQTAIAKIIKHRVTIGLAKLGPQAAAAHGGQLGQFREGVLFLRLLFQQATHGFEPMVFAAGGMAGCVILQAL